MYRWLCQGVTLLITKSQSVWYSLPYQSPLACQCPQARVCSCSQWGNGYRFQPFPGSGFFSTTAASKLKLNKSRIFFMEPQWETYHYPLVSLVTYACFHPHSSAQEILNFSQPISMVIRWKCYRVIGFSNEHIVSVRLAVLSKRAWKASHPLQLIPFFTIR